MKCQAALVIFGAIQIAIGTTQPRSLTGSSIEYERFVFTSFGIAQAAAGITCLVLAIASNADETTKEN